MYLSNIVRYGTFGNRLDTYNANATVVRRIVTQCASLSPGESNPNVYAGKVQRQIRILIRAT